MYIKAKYKVMGSIFFKYFHDVDEMYTFFEEYKSCKFISYEEGVHIKQEALERGYK